MTDTDTDTNPDARDIRTRILDAAEKLFYERGIQAVGMDQLRAAAGVSLKRLYGTFPAKQDIVAAYLHRRDTRWRAALAAHVDAHAPQDATDPADPARVLAVFDWLAAWFATPDYRGCAFLNAYGELGATAPHIARAARDHKRALRAYLTDLVRPLGHPDPTQLAAQLALLIDGAITEAALSATPHAATTARAAAESLLARPHPTPRA
ncbi:TetR family transcriptional regulator [Streptomyces sp. NRRL F-4489]|uniref:TetR/AcrR family transcriptional regulator n=1 Tax=Streptomyces sp. NRRL F-4489 TaxID=1609095 RepID=UPI00074844C6|nr:TetR/AcrR family transcriptional regulator [Streptomyces sp. NRRL F-4489]KUL38528.1 TetR family transcriptional regulator [Streptomyces sp. NRRL F-4489]